MNYSPEVTAAQPKLRPYPKSLPPTGEIEEEQVQLLPIPYLHK